MAAATARDESYGRCLLCPSSRGQERHLDGCSMCLHVEMSENVTIGVGNSDNKAPEHPTMGSGEDPNQSRKRKRNSITVPDDEYNLTKLEKFYSKVILSLTKPSYQIGLGFNNLRQENRRRLCHLLQKLVRQHDWTEITGVLSVVLQGTSKDGCSTANRFKYLVLMELLKHIEIDRSNLTSISGIYDTWMIRMGINLSNKRRSCSVNEVSFVIRLESILSSLMQGNIEGEHQNAKSLMKEQGLESHPMFNMIIGMIFYQLWCSSIPKDMYWKDSEQDFTRMSSDLSATHSQTDASVERFSYNVDSNGHDAVSNEECADFQYDSDTSVMKDKEIYVEDDTDICNERVPLEAVNLQSENLRRDLQPHWFYVNSSENEAVVENNDGHMHSAPDLSAFKRLDSWLLPIRPDFWELDSIIQDDNYKNAVKYLQEAVNSETPVLAALLPLTQLLLIGCREKEALNELEKFCGNSSATLPNRLRANLLECVDPNNSLMLSTCLENTLKTDPTCGQALARLFRLHENGNYSSEFLLEMIALHLDAVFAECNTWRELALCFLKVCQYDEDRMSVCLNGNECGKKQQFSIRHHRIPKLFIHGKSGRAWKFRFRWWLTRHFCRSMLSSDIATGDLQLLTYKAACASHMYGQEFDYVVKTYTCLQKENNRDLFMFLQLHIQNSIGMHLNFERRTY